MRVGRKNQIKFSFLLAIILIFSLFLTACGEDSTPLTLGTTAPATTSSSAASTTTSAVTSGVAATAVAATSAATTNSTVQTTAASTTSAARTTAVATTSAANTTAPSAATTSAARTTVAGGQTSAARFEEAKCPFKLGAGQTDGQNVRCGYVTVPESRATPGGKTIKLAVAIFKSTSRQPAPEPLLFLQGGPGGTSQDIVDAFSSQYDTALFPFKAVLASRDVIIFDQRGVGNSQPSLDCPEVNQLAYKDLTKNFSNKENNERYNTALFQCRDRLVKDGNNLAAYTSAENAADVNDLRLALGFQKVDLYGISYGTRLALTVMRDFPQGIRSVVLDSTYPLEGDLNIDAAFGYDRALNLLFQACAADSACNRAYPDLKGSYSKAVARLNSQPPTVKVTDFDDGKSYDVLVNGSTFVNSMFTFLYVTQLIPALPAMIAQVANGNNDLMSRFLPIALFSGNSTSRGMYFSVQCAEEVPFSSVAAINAAAKNFLPEVKDYFVDPPEAIFDICSKWPSKKAAAIENQPVKSDLPTLVLAGQYDPVTPAPQAQQVSKSLSKSFFAEFPGIGHGVATSNVCGASIMQAFLQNPTTQPDTSCLSRVSLRFQTNYAIKP